MTAITENPAALLAGLDRGESLPARWYTDPSITALETNAIFRKSWCYIGPLSELANPGDYVTGVVGEVPVVAIRNDDGLAAFVNVCRHRRHIVMKDRGAAKIMQCPYHAWAYDLHGRLKAAPRSPAEPGFTLENYPLLEARAEALGPWVFVNLDRDAAPVSSCFGDVLKIIADSGMDLATLRLYSREDWQARANWKTMLENYLECYHCPVAHPGFSAAIDVLPGAYNYKAHGAFMSQVGHVRQSALEGKSPVKIYDARGAIEQSQYHVLWPNMTININPGFPNLSIDIWLPDGPNATKGFSEQYFGPGVSEEFARELIAFNKQVGDEDDVLTDCVQRGLIAGIPDPGRFMTNTEHLVVHFQKRVLDALTGEKAGAPIAAPSSPPASRMIAVEADASAAPEAQRSPFFDVEVFRVEPESELITSFYLRRVDGQKLAPWQPGQFLPIRLTIPGQAQPILRTYTLSTIPNPDFYRLSIRRGDGDALVSRFLHANAKPGYRLEAMQPRGKFLLDRSERPAVFISGGVGITPMIAMAGQIVEEGRKSGAFRRCYFIHGAANGKAHAFGEYVRTLAAEHPAMKVHVRYSEPDADDRLGVTHDGDGRVTLDVLREVLPPFDSYEFYLCGPPPFMQTLYDGLIGLGVGADRIHFESFATGAAMRVEPTPQAAARTAIDGSVAVRFAKSGVDAQWSRDKGSLLEFAEAVGLAPAFGCRSGICGSCATRLDSGSVEYVEEPLATPGPGQILLCCSIPKVEGAGRGGEPALVIDL